ncbi:hypothetical protein CEXT_484561 [Caerostris extrusa]|uniref:Uncharacterized protein n=1 Tax=Caerostris extrusa TaxID=172846 RepID=A0AAV4UZ29_CAEEX|nr:hypothetical protein CEXT_484561 [Caerostris extrusa]
MTIKYWEDLGHNSDTRNGQNHGKKGQRTDQPEERIGGAGRAYGPCPISLSVCTTTITKKLSIMMTVTLKYQPKGTLLLNTMLLMRRNVTPDVPLNTNRFAPLNQEENLNNSDISPLAPRILPIMIIPNFSYANVLTSNITPSQTNLAPTITPNLIQHAPFFNPDELHKTVYIIKEIVNLFTSTSSVDSVFNQLLQAKAPEDKFLFY